MYNFILIAVFLIYLSSNLIGRTGLIAGKVTSTNDEPIISAAVQLIGTKKGTYTNANGNYTINEIPIDKQSLKFSSIGYKDTTVIVNVKSGNNEVNIVLQEDNINFDEVVITGTRTAKRRTDRKSTR